MTPYKHVSSSDVVAVILAGGTSERLSALTWYRAKPAVMIGGNALASFSSSNATNSGIENVVIASQYLPYSLKRFYSEIEGERYGPGKKIDIITPNDTITDAARYKGTADALYQALQIAKRRRKQFVLALAGDHIYKYEFTNLFDQFYNQFDDDSLVVLSQKVSREEAPRFGILTIEQGTTRIIYWKEKPPIGELSQGQQEFDASLGVYFGRTDVVEKILTIHRDLNANGSLGEDIGKDLIPYVLAKLKNVRVHAFPMPNFWADVGEPRALFGAARRIYLDRNPDIIGDESWKIQGIGERVFVNGGQVRYFHSGQFVEGGSFINGAIISPGVIADRASITDCIVMGESQGVQSHIGYKAELHRVIVDKMSEIGHNSAVRSNEGLVLIARGTYVHPHVKIETEHDGIVAELEEHRKFKRRIEGIEERRRPSLFLPDGTRITLEELAA